MNLYLHVEVSLRELDSKLLLGVIAASRGHHVLISDISEIERGLKRGILLGSTLKEIQAWWIEKDFKPNRKQCLNKSRTFLINSKLL